MTENEILLQIVTALIASGSYKLTPGQGWKFNGRLMSDARDILADLKKEGLVPC